MANRNLVPREESGIGIDSVADPKGGKRRSATTYQPCRGSANALEEER